MIHQRQRLPLGLEAGDHLPRVHSGLDELERDQPLDRLLLLGHPDRAHAPFADVLQQLVRADLCAGFFRNRLVGGGRGNLNDWLLQEFASSEIVHDQLFHLCAQARSVLASSVQKRFPFLGRGNRDGCGENRLGRNRLGHGPRPCSRKREIILPDGPAAGGA
jgi:hypothetical protein